LLTKLTLESFPTIRFNILAIFSTSLGVQPLPEALKMDVAHGACALARRDQRVMSFILLPKANSANFAIQSKLGSLRKLEFQ
jgi:hypothetical protein